MNNQVQFDSVAEYKGAGFYRAAYMQTQNVWWLSYAFLEDVYKLMLRALHGIAVEETDAEVHTLTHPTLTRII